MLLNCGPIEKSLESPLDCKEIKPVLKEVNPEFSLEGLVLIWSNDMNRGLIGKDPDVGKD